jgi:hypothetical protein
MQVSHVARTTVASFDDPNLVSTAGLVPIVRLVEKVGLRDLADQWLTVPTDKGANTGLKVVSLVAGMVAGADSIADMAVLRQGGMKKIFTSIYAPSTLGSFLRSFTFGHVRQLDAVASRFLINLAAEAPIVPTPADGGLVFVDVDDTIIQVHGPKKQGAGFGYSGVRDLNALLATVSTGSSAPVVVAQRLRKGAAASPRGAARIVADALKTVTRLPGANTAPVLLRADSAYYGHATVTAALRAGADVSVTARQDPAVKRAIGAIPDDGWTKIKYTNAIYDPDTRAWISDAEVAEVPFTAFSSKPKKDRVEGRLASQADPRVEQQEAVSADPVRHAPVPRVLHHQHPRHDHRRPDTPPTRDHRAGSRRSEELRPRPPPVRDLHRERRLAGPGRHRIQPHPDRRDYCRSGPRLRDNCHDPPETDQHPREDRVLRTPNHPAPTQRMALGNSLDEALRPRPLTTTKLTSPVHQADSARSTTSSGTPRAARPALTPRPPRRTAQKSRGNPSPKNIGGSRLNARAIGKGIDTVSVISISENNDRRLPSRRSPLDALMRNGHRAADVKSGGHPLAGGGFEA